MSEIVLIAALVAAFVIVTTAVHVVFSRIDPVHAPYLATDVVTAGHVPPYPIVGRVDPGTRVRFHCDAQMGTWLNAFDEPVVNGDGYVYGTVETYDRDDGDVLVRTEVGAHPCWVPVGELEPVGPAR